MVQKLALVFLITILGFSCWGKSQKAASTLPLEFISPLSDKWERDFEINDLYDDGRHYLFKGQDNIDLNISAIDSSVLTEVEKNGLEFFVKEKLKGANFINDLFSLNRLEVSDSKYVKSTSTSKPHIIVLSSQQKLDDKVQIKMSEKYFLIPGSGYHIQLRWNSDANPQEVKEAQDLFESISLQVGS